MADNTAIEWCDATWQPVTGCAVVSPGCTNCYAMRLAGTRMKHHPSRKGLTRDTKAGPVWTGEVRFNEEWLDQPLRWRKPRRIFVCAHGDLFAEGVPDEWIDRVFAVMALAPQHTFLVLTKRAERMRAYAIRAVHGDRQISKEMTRIAGADATLGAIERFQNVAEDLPIWRALPNVWLGVSVEDQPRADERIPHLLQTPAAKRFLSCEPLLGDLDVRKWLGGVDIVREHGSTGAVTARPRHGIDWLIAGGEGGPSARPMLRQWAQSLRDQCAAAGVAYFHKQNGEWIDADEWLDKINAGPGQMYGPGEQRWEPRRPLNYDDARYLAEATGRGRPELIQHHSDGTTLIRVGKAAAGRLLDGREWNEVPA